MYFNVRGLISPFKCKALSKEAMSQQCNILCVQETHFAHVKAPKSSHMKFTCLFIANAPTKRKWSFSSHKRLCCFYLNAQTY